MPTVRRVKRPKDESLFKLASHKSQASRSQTDKIDYDLLLLDNEGSIHKELLIEIRRDIDDYSQRLSKLRERLVDVVDKYDNVHKQ